MKQPRRHTTLLFITLGIIAVVLLLIDMATGDTYIPIPKVWAVLTGGECDEMTRNILLSIRFIRVVVAGLIGIALSVSGLQMQTVFQNPLADPYLLGVSSGAPKPIFSFVSGLEITPQQLISEPVPEVVAMVTMGKPRFFSGIALPVPPKT
jgi:iron complex transport system permease protein